MRDSWLSWNFPQFYLSFLSPVYSHTSFISATLSHISDSVKLASEPPQAVMLPGCAAMKKHLNLKCILLQ